MFSIRIVPDGLSLATGDVVEREMEVATVKFCLPSVVVSRPPTSTDPLVVEDNATSATIFYNQVNYYKVVYIIN